jgi:diguanylate cyclase (GGDEF)-like protein/PAS domain S-box-containing protein
VVYVNGAAVRLVGAAHADDVLGRSIFDVVLSEHHGTIVDRIRAMQDRDADVAPLDVTIRTFDGRTVHCEVVSGRVRFGGGDAVQSVVRDAGERRRLEAELRRLATTDPLTGVCNRRHLFEQLETEWSRAARHGRRLSVLVIDVDRFKRVNDRFGHAAGDQVLCVMVERFRAALRSSDTLGRLGGEEFAAILPEIDSTGASAAAERVRVAVANDPAATDAGPIELTVSVGATECRIGLEEPDDALKRADDALYEAKNRGRDRTVVL